MSKNKNCSRLVVALSSILLLSGCGGEPGELRCVLCHSSEDGSIYNVSLESSSISNFAKRLGSGNPVANVWDNELLIDANNPNDNKIDTSDTVMPLNAFQVERKVKYIAVVAAETEVELYTVQDLQGSLVQGEFETLVNGGLQSDGFIENRRYFFELSLQKNPTDNNYIRKSSRNSNSGITHVF